VNNPYLSGRKKTDSWIDGLMRKLLLHTIIILAGLLPVSLKGQGQSDSGGNPSYYHVFEGYYIEKDSTKRLDNWVEKGTNILFVPKNDSLIISIDIGGKDKIFFMGMAVRIENPGFEAPGISTEFYHWTFTSHIKEGIRNAFISKEYVSGSLEKSGRKDYLIHIVFFDQTEFLFYTSELKPKVLSP
jgi:hypothetical protein